MAIDQVQIDKILGGASSEDPEVRLDNLEKEVDFIKTSIKRLLIDLRERMNELDNPFTQASFNRERVDAMEAMEARALDPLDDLAQKTKEPVEEEPEPAFELPVRAPAAAEQHASGRNDLYAPPPGSFALPPANVPQTTGKLKLNRVHRLFEWTNRSGKKYGHDRFLMMIDSYLTMGYITESACTQVKEIARMMPPYPGEGQTVGPNEFVSELYVLNRILDPGDTSLDRDMIEVMMIQRQNAGAPQKQDKKIAESDVGDEWLSMLDRI